MKTTETTGKTLIEFESMKELTDYLTENLTGELLSAQLAYSPSCEATIDGSKVKYKDISFTVRINNESAKETLDKIVAEEKELKARLETLASRKASLEEKETVKD